MRGVQIQGEQQHLPGDHTEEKAKEQGNDTEQEEVNEEVNADGNVDETGLDELATEKDSDNLPPTSPTHTCGVVTLTLTQRQRRVVVYIYRERASDREREKARERERCLEDTQKPKTVQFLVVLCVQDKAKQRQDRRGQEKTKQDRTVQDITTQGRVCLVCVSVFGASGGHACLLLLC
jgi:hypothetical protein